MRKAELVALGVVFLVGCGKSSGRGGALAVAGVTSGQSFLVRIENLSGGSSSPTPFSRGAWAVHDSTRAALFETGKADRGEGLARIAEDGNPDTLAVSLSRDSSLFATGVFDTPLASAARGGIRPGQTYEFTVTARPGMALSFASMLGQSNDIFVGPGDKGIALFDSRGMPLSARDVTGEVALWDVGSEITQAPSQGPLQGPRQPAPDTGPREGVVSPFVDTTRALPFAQDLARLTVTEANGELTVTIANVSSARGFMTTPLSRLFYAVHDDSYRLFATGETAPANGLENLAEDGDPSFLLQSALGVAGVSTAGMGGAGLQPGGQYSFSVRPDRDHRRLSIATMVGQTNDAFLAFGPEGVELLTAEGAARPVAAIEEDMERLLATWDAGTEANETPGAGSNQGPRQAARNTGPVDPDANVRLYRDATNDLAGPRAGGFVDVSIRGLGAGSFEVTLTNTSAATAYPGNVSPVVHATHDGTVRFFETGMPASVGIERLAEDGRGAELLDILGRASGVLAAARQSVPEGATAAGPLAPGGVYRFTVTADASHRFLSLAAMLVPSNDTFVAFGPEGLALLDASGAARPDADLTQEARTMLVAWDAGTERNQAGASGPDQGPRQAAPDTGADEGRGLVRVADRHPRIEHLVRVTITPLR